VWGRRVVEESERCWRAHGKLQHDVASLLLGLKLPRDAPAARSSKHRTTAAPECDHWANVLKFATALANLNIANGLPRDHQTRSHVLHVKAESRIQKRVLT
jgi:hypothetical protein